MARPSSLEQSPSQREEGHARETSVSRLEWGADGRGVSTPPAWSTDLGPHPSPAVSNPGEPPLEVGVVVLVITGLP